MHKKGLKSLKQNQKSLIQHFKTYAKHQFSGSLPWSPEEQYGHAYVSIVKLNIFHDSYSCVCIHVYAHTCVCVCHLHCPDWKQNNESFSSWHSASTCLLLTSMYSVNIGKKKSVQNHYVQEWSTLALVSFSWHLTASHSLLACTYQKLHYQNKPVIPFPSLLGHICVFLK